MLSPAVLYSCGFGQVLWYSNQFIFVLLQVVLSIFSLFVIPIVFLDFLPLICIFDSRVLVTIVLNLHRNFVVEPCKDNIHDIPWAWMTFLWSSIFFDSLLYTLKSLIQSYFTYLARSMSRNLHLNQRHYVWDIYFIFSLWDLIVSGYM